MRLVQYERERAAEPEAGIVHDDHLLPVAGVLAVSREEMGMPIPAPLKGRSAVPMEDLLRNWDRAHQNLAAAMGRIARSPTKVEELALDTTHLRRRAPLTRPASIRDFYAFEDHVASAWARRGEPVPKEWYDAPVFYFSNPHAIYGHGEMVPRPRATRKLDFELEVGWVIGREASDLAAQEAEGAIVGMTILNDWSARDLQASEMRVGLGPAKGKDFATSLGPELVTLDELKDHRRGDHYDLEMVARVNGDEASRGNLATLHWTIGEMTAYASRDARLGPGDVLGTGTVGSGSILDLGSERWLEPGDEVELEVTGLGRLTNRVVGR